MILSDLGERKIIEVIKEYFSEVNDSFLKIGDDCSATEIDRTKGDILVSTTDACPLPVAFLLGEEDYYTYGWFSIIINVSDVASMGATPTGILLAANAKNEMKLDDFKRFLKGAVDASKYHNCPIIGGNIKDAKRFECVGTAFGMVHKKDILTRSAAKDGDIVIAVGDLGYFWASVYAKMKNIPLDSEDFDRISENLYKPKAKVKAGLILSKYANACMDNSDGLSGALYEIAKQSKVDFNIDLDAIEYDKTVLQVAEEVGIDVKRFSVGWGDWLLVSTVSKENIEDLKDEFKKAGIDYSILGKTKNGSGQVFLKDGSKFKTMNNFDDERFSKTSYFTNGLESYLEFLEGLDLTKE